MGKWKFCAVLAFCMVVAPSTISAGEKEDSVIAKTIEAYGGDALLKLKTLRINDAYKSFREGQSRSASEIDQVSYQTSVTIDYVNRRKSIQSFGGVLVPDLFIQHAFYNGETGFRVQHMAETVSENPRASFEGVDRGLSWRFDIVLVKLLSENRAKASYKGLASYIGKPHEVISFDAEGYPEFTLYINEATGMVGKMTRPDGATGRYYSYIFSDYRKQGGFTYASDTYVMRGGKPESLTASRSVEFNTNIDAAYHVPSKYKAPEKMRFIADMTVKELAEGVSHVGKNGGFSIFVDAGDYYIASGGYAGLKERYNAVKSFTGSDKPLRYQVVTHHHADHIGGLKEVADLGVTFIVAKEQVEAVRNTMQPDISDDRFLFAKEDNSFAAGLVRVVDIASWHADHNLVTYIPHAKLAFSADHFFTFKETSVPDPAEMYAEFKQALDSYDLDINWFAAAHSVRVLSYDDLVQSATGPFKKLACPADWAFCANPNKL